MSYNKLAFKYSLLGMVLMANGVGATTETSTQDAPPPQLSVNQILDRNAEARGGIAAWRAVTAMKMSGKLDAARKRPDPAMLDQNEKRFRTMAVKFKVSDQNAIAEASKPVELPFNLELKRPNLSRMEIQFNGQLAVQTYDGSSGWKLRPWLESSAAEPYTQDELKMAAEQQPLDGALIDAAAKGTSVSLGGTDKVNGQYAYKLKLTFKDGLQRNVWVDAKSFLEVKMDGSRKMDGKMKPLAIYYKDYRKVDKVMVPFLLETQVEGVRETESIHIEQVAVNPSLDSVRFSKPAAL